MQKTQEMRVQSLGREDPLEEEMATHSGILAWEVPWTCQSTVHVVTKSWTQLSMQESTQVFFYFVFQSLS